MQEEEAAPLCYLHQQKSFCGMSHLLHAELKRNIFGKMLLLSPGRQKSFLCKTVCSLRMPTKIGFASNTVQHIYSTYFPHIYPPSLFLQGLSGDPLYTLAPTSLSLSLSSRGKSTLEGTLGEWGRKGERRKRRRGGEWSASPSFPYSAFTFFGVRTFQSRCCVFLKANKIL